MKTVCQEAVTSSLRAGESSTYSGISEVNNVLYVFRN